MSHPRLPQLWFSAISPILLALLMLAFGAASADARKAEPTDATDLNRLFQRGTLQIATPDAKLHNFNIWLADDEPRRQRGLMFVKHLASQDGMLFVYPQAQPIAMWMKNCVISLDMVFVDTNGKVVNVVANTEPGSLKTIESGGTVLGVVELAAGTAARLKIAPGAQVIHPAFANSPR
ncbi:MAG: DUF192 domain-containing protein [Steroidobacter sp.]